DVHHLLTPRSHDMKDVFENEINNSHMDVLAFLNNQRNLIVLNSVLDVTNVLCEYEQRGAELNEVGLRVTCEDTDSFEIQYYRSPPHERLGPETAVYDARIPCVVDVYRVLDKERLVCIKTALAAELVSCEEDKRIHQLFNL